MITELNQAYDILGSGCPGSDRANHLATVRLMDASARCGRYADILHSRRLGLPSAGNARRQINHGSEVWKYLRERGCQALMLHCWFLGSKLRTSAQRGDILAPLKSTRAGSIYMQQRINLVAGTPSEFAGDVFDAIWRLRMGAMRGCAVTSWKEDQECLPEVIIPRWIVWTGPGIWRPNERRSHRL